MMFVCSTFNKFAIKKMKTTSSLITVLLIFLFSNDTIAQRTEAAAGSTYKTAAGIRLGYPLSASIKQFITDDHALEVYLGTRGFGYGRWINVSGAYLIHSELDEVLEGLKWYAGFGGSAYFWNYNNSFVLSNDFSNRSFGVQGYLGLDFKLKGEPINVSIDWIPTLFLGRVNLNAFSVRYGSVGVRYVLF